MEMVGPSDNERVRHVVVNVKAMKGMAGMVRDYDLLFTENGVLFANTAGAWNSVKMGLGGQFGVVGALAAQKSMESNKTKGRSELQGLTLGQILEKSDKSFYIPYLEVQAVTFKKGLTGIGKMSFLTPEGKWNCEFPKDQIEAARTAIAESLSAKVEG